MHRRAGSDASYRTNSTAIGDLVAADLPAFLADLEMLVDIDCGSYTKEGVDAVGSWVAGVLERLGGTVTRHPHDTLGDTIVGEFRGRPGGRRVLLIGHMDTVFDPGTAAARPFRDRRRGRLRSGRHGHEGRPAHRACTPSRASDDARRGELPFERLWFVANPDEEIGSPTSTPIIRELAGGVDVGVRVRVRPGQRRHRQLAQGHRRRPRHRPRPGRPRRGRAGEGPQRDPRPPRISSRSSTRSRAAGRA